jgi:hypothetical protein
MALDETFLYDYQPARFACADPVRPGRASGLFGPTRNLAIRQGIAARIPVFL